MDLAREVSFPETVDADGKEVSCGLLLSEAIDVPTGQVSLAALGCFHGVTGFCKYRRLYEC